MLGAMIAALSLAIWAVLLLARGGFWRARVRDEPVPAGPAQWPHVAAVIPARNEADCIATSIGSLMQQDYPGTLDIILVDDDSSDGTAEVARSIGGPRRLTVTRVPGMPAGWTGKMFALRHGTRLALSGASPPKYVLLTDADIAHAPDSVRSLVARAEAGGQVLTSLMAKLRCESLPERSHVPAFVLFFEMLFPFSWVNDLRRATAAAAGGCMLARSDALQAIGGIDSIRDALIDDCALAKRMKTQGPIWLGLTERVRSVRHYDTWHDVRRMISRSAYAQLNYSPLLLIGTTLGMALTFLAAPLLAVFGGGAARVIGALTYALMVLAFQPMLRFYRLSPLWGLALPVIALAYMAYTLDSAWQHARGRGGSWKGRAQASALRS
jgi:hopene-associated glycosyltransferase HpnB